MKPRSLATALLIVLSCGAAGCATQSDASEPQVTVASTEPTGPQTIVPDRFAPVFNATVTITEDGVDPETLFLPAGRQVRLAIRTRTTDERHYRIVGMPATEIRWLKPPEYTLFDLEQMTPEEQAEVGFDPTKTDAEHFLHHLEPTMMPMREESPEGIKPLPGEVHGWMGGHGTELITFFPLTTGRYQVEDPLRPGTQIATVVVFAPPDTDQ